MRRPIVGTFIVFFILLTSGSGLAGPHVRFGVVVAPPPIWIDPPAIICRGYYLPFYYCYPPEPYCYPSPPPYYSSRAKVRVEINSIPEVEVNGVYQGLTPMWIELPEGRPAVLRLSKAGYIL